MEINNHEDVRYSCDQCDFKSKWTRSLKRHLDSLHGDVRYTCEQCDYKATQTHSLKMNEFFLEIKNEGVNMYRVVLTGAAQR